MASFPQFYSDDSFSSAELSQFPYPISAAAAAAGESTNYGDCCTGSSVSSGGGTVSSGNNGLIWGTEENFPVVSFDNVLAPESDVVSSSPLIPFTAEQLGIYDSMVPTLAEYNNMAMRGTNEIQNYGARFQLPSDACGFGDDCCAFMHDLKPMRPATGENWVICLFFTTTFCLIQLIKNIFAWELIS